MISKLAFKAEALARLSRLKRAARNRIRLRHRRVRPGMRVVFRAELMPGRSAAERTYRVTELLPHDHVLLEGLGGEHPENAFEPER